MYNVKLQIPHVLREYGDVIEQLENNKPKQAIIKKAELELRQQELDVAAKQLNIKFDALSIERNRVKELDKISQLLDVVSGQIEHFTNSRAIFYDEFNTKVATLAFAIAKKVIMNQVDVDENFILNIVDNAINESGNDDELVIRISPDDKAILDQHWSHIKKEHPDKSLQIVGDPDISRGSTIVETESGDIDARIEKQLDVIEKTLKIHIGGLDDSKKL